MADADESRRMELVLDFSGNVQSVDESMRDAVAFIPQILSLLQSAGLVLEGEPMQSLRVHLKECTYVLHVSDSQIRVRRLDQDKT